MRARAAGPHAAPPTRHDRYGEDKPTATLAWESSTDPKGSCYFVGMLPGLLSPLPWSARVLTVCSGITVLCGLSVAGWMLTSMALNGGNAQLGGIAFDFFALWPTLTAIVLIPVGLVAGLVTLARSCTPPGGRWMMAGHAAAIALPWLMVGIQLLAGQELTGWEGVAVFFAVPLSGLIIVAGLVKFYRAS